MKKLLIIQTDEAYFLFETIQVLDRYRDSFKEFELTILTNETSLEKTQDGSSPIIPGVTTSIGQVLNSTYDLSINLSLNENSWSLHEKIQSDNKVGAYYSQGQLIVPDVWSAYYLTLKGKAPFLAFHIQDLYKNILGIKKYIQPLKDHNHFQILVFGLCQTELFSAEEQENFLNLICEHYPKIQIKDISEIDPLSDLSHVLYIGPTSLDALKICEDGARGIFLTRQFQGFNLLPRHSGHSVISSRNGRMQANHLMQFLDKEINHSKLPESFPYSVYQIDEEHIFGSYLKSLNLSDDHYPIYQAHVVLWNFVLNLFDINLEITQCHEGQISLLQDQVAVLQKLVRLYDYAMTSVDTIHQEAKSQNADHDKIQGHLKNLREMEAITDSISQSHSFLRPLLDFYRIRRGQNQGATLLDQAQHSFLTYSEEHQALKALQELFTVTLRKNEVSI